MMTEQDAKNILDAADLIRKARIVEGIADKPFQVQKIVLPLATAMLETQPFVIGFPFKSIFVQDATDILAEISIRIGTRDTSQSPFTMNLNDSFASDIPISNAYLHWAAQAGKSMTLIVFTDAFFQSGSQISVTGGGVSISEGSTIAIGGQVTLAAGVAGIIVPSLSTRKVATYQNKTGAPLFVGDATVTGSGATEGIEIPDDGIGYFKNTGALYGFSAAGGVVSRLEEA